MSAPCSGCGISTKPCRSENRLPHLPAHLWGRPPNRCGPSEHDDNGVAVVQRIEPIILVAAVGFYALAMTSQGMLPFLEKKVTRPGVVKTIAGETVPAVHL